MEIRRILGNYKLYLIAIGVILIITVGSLYNISDNQLIAKYSEIVAAEYDIHSLKVENEQLFLRDPMAADCNNKVIALLEQQGLYLEEYQRTNIAIIERTRELQARGKIKDGDKILEDFTRINDVEVTIGNDYAVTLITDNTIINIMLCLFCIVIVFFFFDERKAGMWNFVHSTVKGREHLALTRIVIGIVIVAITAALAYLAINIVNVQVLEGVDYFRSIQSIECFGQIPYELNVLEFLILFGIVKVLGSILIFLVVFLIFSVANNRNLAMLVTILLICVETILYIIVKPNSNLEFLKIYNIYSIAFGIEDFTVYRNYMLLGEIPIYRLEARLIGIVLGSLMLGIVSCVVSYYKRPTRDTSWMEVIMGNRAVGKIFAAIPNSIVEFRKQLFFDGGIFILLCAIILGGVINPKSDSQYKNSNSRLRVLYETCGGNVDVAQELLQELKLELLECDSSETVRKTMLEEDIRSFENRINYIKKLQLNGYDVQLIDEKPYLIYFNSNSFKKIKINMLIVITGMILLFSDLFAFEEKHSVLLMVNSTQLGKNKIFTQKIIYACVMFIVLCCSTLGIYNLAFAYDYGFAHVGDAAATVSIFENIGAGYTIGDMVLAQNLIILAVLLFIGVIIFTLSKFVGYKRTLLITSMLFILPIVFELFGIEWAKYISVTNLGDIARLI